MLGLALAACDDGDSKEGGAPTPDAATSDAATPDAGGAADSAAASLPDGATPDAAMPDAAAADAGPPLIPLDHPVSAACHDDLRPGEKVVFSQGFANGIEGIAFGPGGALYVSEPRGDRVWKLDAAGNATELASVSGPIGLAAAADGALLVADGGESNDADVLDGAVWRLDGAGAKTRFAEGLATPNFLAALPDGGALVSDDFDTRVFHVRADGTSAPLLTVPSPNGMAFGPGRRGFYVASTFTPRGEITRFEVGPDGLPDPASGRVLFEIGSGATLDGVAVDEHDQVYVAANVRGTILRVRGDGTGEPVPVATGLRTPASLAFGLGPDFDPCSIYVTELLGNRVWRIAVGATGVPLP
jgi:sugar lactone lactonase YvrE